MTSWRFSIALHVNPSRLLLADDAGDGPMQLTANTGGPAWEMWAWADGHPGGDRIVPLFGGVADDFARWARPKELRGLDLHHVVRGAYMLRMLVARVVRLAGPGDPTSGDASGAEERRAQLREAFANARRSLQRLTDELNTFEEEVESRG